MSHDGGGSLFGDLIWLIIVLVLLFFVWYRYGGQQHYRETKEKATPYLKMPTFDDVEKISPQQK